MHISPNMTHLVIDISKIKDEAQAVKALEQYSNALRAKGIGFLAIAVSNDSQNYGVASSYTRVQATVLLSQLLSEYAKDALNAEEAARNAH